MMSICDGVVLEPETDLTRRMAFLLAGGDFKE
jgi:hypothetical protein